MEVQEGFNVPFLLANSPSFIILFRYLQNPWTCFGRSQYPVSRMSWLTWSGMPVSSMAADDPCPQGFTLLCQPAHTDLGWPPTARSQKHCSFCLARLTGWVASHRAIRAPKPLCRDPCERHKGLPPTASVWVGVLQPGQASRQFSPMRHPALAAPRELLTTETLRR